MKVAAKMMSGLVKLSLIMTLAVSAAVNAAPIINGTLGLTGGNPDIQSNFLSFDYIESTDLFSINGFADQLTYNGSSQAIANGVFTIAGSADAGNANLALTIQGDIGSGVENLLSGSLNVMANSGVGVFEFLFGGLSGSLASLFGTEAGLIFSDSAVSGFDFSSDLSTQYTGVSDTFGTGVSVSAPATFSLSILGFVLLAVARRKRV